ncbi:MAG: class I SAM-dependent methyltransferase [Candidatus Nanoarchaeia archaeon]|nr:class I SAM-dependent methyltransferase [Candidatus Nanoarchaeia archaeon]
MVKDENLKGYEKYAKEYAIHTSDKLIQFQLNHFISLLPKNAKVLDAGCGSGRDSEYFAEEKLDVTAIDAVEALLKEAKKNIKNVKFSVMDMKNLKFNKGSFDGIWCMSSISDIKKNEVSDVFKNFSKVLKENGILYISVREGQDEKVIEKGFFNDLPRFYAFYQQTEMEEILRNNKFKILSSNTSNSNGINWVEIFAQKE